MMRVFSGLSRICSFGIKCLKVFSLFNDVFMLLNVSPFIGLCWKKHWIMRLGLTPISRWNTAKSHSASWATRISSCVRSKMKERFFNMKQAVISFRSCKVFTTNSTLVYYESSPKLPKYPSPRYCVCFKILNEALYVPIWIRLMRSYFTSIHIY